MGDEERIGLSGIRFEKNLPQFGSRIVDAQRLLPEGLGVKNAEILTSKVSTLLPIGSMYNRRERILRNLCKEGNHLIILDNANSSITSHFNLPSRHNK